MDDDTARGEAPAPRSAGALLAAAREAAGLTIDAVAQQLKLAPRQVRALEEDDYTHLPGRTFVRGFVRNYARLLHLDPEAVVAALPAAAAVPALDVPELQETAPTMGELPVSDHSRPAWTKWAIPATLAAIVAAAAIYEWLRPARDAMPPAAREVPAEPPAKPEKSAVPVPNPLAAPATAPVAGSTAQSPAMATGSPAQSPAPAAGDQKLVLTFRDNSWTEIRDQAGRVLLSQMNPAGSTQTVTGTPPLELVIGNAVDVSVSYRGQPVDLAPYTRQNVARLTLP